MALDISLSSSTNFTLNNTTSYQEDVNSSGYFTDDWYDLYYEEYKERDQSYKARFIDIISIVLSLLGIFANTFSIYVVKRINKRLSTHLKLIISLCISDSLILVPCLVMNVLNMTQQVDICFNVASRLITDLALFATLLNLLAIAVDHYLAILKPLMYKKSITNIRGMCAVMAIWIASLLAISVEIILGAIDKKEMEPLCEAIAYDNANAEVGIVTFIFIVLFVIFVIYIRIYICVVRNRAAHSKIRHRQTDTSNVKALVTTSLFVLTFVMFWTPIGIWNVHMYTVDYRYIVQNIDDVVQIGEILYVILLLNAIADPIIYTFRLPQVYRRCFLFKTQMKSESIKMTTLTSEA